MSSYVDVILRNENPTKSKIETFHYQVIGNSQTRNGTTFIENDYTTLIGYNEIQKDSRRTVLYKLEKINQTCSGLIFQFAENFSQITSELELRLNEGFEVEEILNHKNILDRWNNEKKRLKDQFKIIPNVNQLLDNYEKSIHDEDKLRNSLFYVSLTQLFFPRVKHLLNEIEGVKKYERNRDLHGFYFGLKIPIIEELFIKKIENNQIVATIEGRLDVSKIKETFLQAFKMLYGNDTEQKDISFTSRLQIIYDENLNYKEGSLDEFFEVKGVHFKKDKISFTKLVKDE